MELYHATNDPETILSEGFRDTDHGGEWTGVWLSNRMNTNELDKSILALEVDDDAIASFNVQPDSGHKRALREYVVPALIVNRFGPARLIQSKEEVSTKS